MERRCPGEAHSRWALLSLQASGTPQVEEQLLKKGLIRQVDGVVACPGLLLSWVVSHLFGGAFRCLPWRDLSLFDPWGSLLGLGGKAFSIVTVAVPGLTMGASQGGL